MPSSRSAARALGSAMRVEILHALQTAGRPLLVTELAEAVGRHTNTVREHLDRLVTAGFAVRTVERRTTRGRPRIRYEAVARAAGATLDERFRASLTALFLDEAGAIEESAAQAPGGSTADAATRAMTGGFAGSAPAGAGPGPTGADADPDDAAAERRQMAALGVHLEDVGFAPEPDPAARCVHLRRCPFATLARERTETTCAVHLDVIRGVLEREGGPLTAERLEPFVGPEHCVLHLARS